MAQPALLRLLYVHDGQQPLLTLPVAIGHRPCEWHVIHIVQEPQRAHELGVVHNLVHRHTVREAVQHLRKLKMGFDLACLHGQSISMLQIGRSKNLHNTPKLAIWEDAPTTQVSGMSLMQWIEAAQVVQIAVSHAQIKEKLRWQTGIPAEWSRILDTGHGTGMTLNAILEETMLLASMPGERHYQQCTQCVLDTKDDAGIRFDETGKCSYCHGYERDDPRTKLFEQESREEALVALVDRIKKSRKHAKYDCILGVSGGVDSSYLALKLKEIGLNPLLVHVDNGYNSPISDRNVRCLSEKLEFDLELHVLDQDECRLAQLALLRASVIDIEMLTDHVLNAYLYARAKDLGIHFIISGHNHVTEGILPLGWYHDKTDVLNLRSISIKFSGSPLKNVPTMDYWARQYLLHTRRFESIRLLNYFDYDSSRAREEIACKIGWEDYGGKHTESVFTRFFQHHILPEKFGVDKRKAHYASLICSGTMSMGEALLELAKPLYEAKQLEEDKATVLDKLGLTDTEFATIMALPIKKHTDYPSYLTRHYRWEKLLLGKLRPVIRLLKALKGIHSKPVQPMRLAGTA